MAQHFGIDQIAKACAKKPIEAVFEAPALRRVKKFTEMAFPAFGKRPIGQHQAKKQEGQVRDENLAEPSKAAAKAQKAK